MSSAVSTLWGAVSETRFSHAQEVLQDRLDGQNGRNGSVEESYYTTSMACTALDEQIQRKRCVCVSARENEQVI